MGGILGVFSSVPELAMQRHESKYQSISGNKWRVCYLLISLSL